MEVLIFVDGSCIGNPGETGVGVTFLVNNQVKMLAKYFGFGTNNTAELKAAVLALRSIKNKTLTVNLLTDSQLVKGFLSEGWKPKANKRLVAELLSLASEFENFSVTKVKAHSKDGSQESFWNNRADELARWAAITKEDFSAKWRLNDFNFRKGE